MEYPKKYKVLLLLSLIALVTPYIYISRYANPVADDLVYAFDAKHNDLVALLIRNYKTWNGRYFSNILMYSNPMAYDALIIYKLIPVFIILSTIISFGFFLHVFFEKQIDTLETWIFVLLLSLLYLYQMPIISEGIYWYTGAVTYQLATILSLIYLGLLRLFTLGKFIFKSKRIHIVVLSLLLMVCMGFNETHMIILLGFACLSFFISRKNKLQYQKLFIYLFCISLICAAIMYGAPGNEGRASFANGNHRFVSSLLFSIAQTLRFFLKWVISIPLLLLSIGYFFLNRKLSAQLSLFSRSFYLSPGISISVLFLVIFIAAFPSYWAMGMLGQHRTMNVAYYFFLIFWFINLTVCFNAYSAYELVKPISKRLVGVAIAVILVSFLLTRNGYDLITDLWYNKASGYDQQMIERAELMQINTDTIYFHPMVHPPKSLFLYDITKDSGNWLNLSYSLYFADGQKKVIKQE
ncbi:MAG TPA: DUF6056 family protein [Bacteroidia bacterium]|jgi:hypothetical protein|nr:DUF6056 family protein [Bacteroidia bacterium]